MFKFIRNYFNGDHNEYVGKVGELTTDDNGLFYAHNGQDPGGFPLYYDVNTGTVANHSDGSRANATLLNYEYNFITIHNDYDTVVLPPAKGGRFVALITKKNTNIVKIWSQTGDTLNNSGNSFAYYNNNTDQGGMVGMFFCSGDGNWTTNLVIDD